jgi:hypothetical protein
MTPMVEHHHRGSRRERRGVVGEVLLGAGEPVHHEERGSSADLLDGEADTVVGGDPHPAAPPLLGGFGLLRRPAARLDGACGRRGP